MATTKCCRALKLQPVTARLQDGEFDHLAKSQMINTPDPGRDRAGKRTGRGHEGRRHKKLYAARRAARLAKEGQT